MIAGSTCTDSASSDPVRRTTTAPPAAVPSTTEASIASACASMSALTSWSWENRSPSPPVGAASSSAISDLLCAGEHLHEPLLSPRRARRPGPARPAGPGRPDRASPRRLPPELSPVGRRRPGVARPASSPGGPHDRLLRPRPRLRRAGSWLLGADSTTSREGPRCRAWSRRRGSRRTRRWRRVPPLGPSRRRAAAGQGGRSGVRALPRPHGSCSSARSTWAEFGSARIAVASSLARKRPAANTARTPGRSWLSTWSPQASTSSSRVGSGWSLSVGSSRRGRRDSRHLCNGRMGRRPHVRWRPG